MSAWTPEQREQAIEAAAVALFRWFEQQDGDQYVEWDGKCHHGMSAQQQASWNRASVAVDAVLPLVEQASEYEQVGWWYEDSHTFMRKTAEPIQPLHESWEPVYRRVRKP